MQKRSEQIDQWFNRELRVNPLPPLEHAYHAPVRYEVLKYFRLLDPKDELLIKATEDVKQSTRRVTLLLTLERILNNIDKFETGREEEMLVKLASIVRELRFYHCNHKMTAIGRALATLIRHQEKDGHFPVSLLANVFIIQTILEYGIIKNPYAEAALRWLLKQQNPDKGWGKTTEGYSDIWLTNSVLQAFSYNVKYTQNTRIRKAVDFMLSHLYLSNKGGVIEGKEAWEDLENSYYLKESFGGGILAVLEMLARLNSGADDPKIREMLNWLKEKQTGSGLWPAQTWDRFNRKTDERVTMRVIRVFKLFYLTPKKGAGTIKTFKIKQEGRTNTKKPAFISDPLNNPKPEIASEES